MANKVVVHSQPDLTKASKRSRDPIKIIKEEMVIPDRLLQYCNGKKCFISTYGCQANVVDSQNILGILEELGYIPVDDSEGIMDNVKGIYEAYHTLGGNGTGTDVYNKFLKLRIMTKEQYEQSIGSN